MIGDKAPTMLASLRDGTVQAVGGSVEELVWLYQTGLKARSLSGEYRELPSSGIFVIEKTFADRHELLVKVARSIARATLFSMTNPRAAVAVMSKLVPTQFQSVEAGRVLFHTYLELSTPSHKNTHGEPVFGRAMPEGWERLQTILLSGETPALEKRLDLSPVVTGQLISEVNRFDREKVRQQARAFKP
jgi:NitT/TauT family transport system substrate-binding protein